MTFPCLFSLGTPPSKAPARSGSAGRDSTTRLRTNSAFYLACCFTLLAWQGRVQAEGGLPDTETPSLSFDDVVATALSRHLSLEAARLEIDRAQALLQQARASALPTLTLGFNHPDSITIACWGQAICSGWWLALIRLRATSPWRCRSCAGALGRLAARP